MPLLGGCDRRPAGPAARGAVLISIDSLRADHLGAYGYSRATSPNIDRLAADGVLFENAYSTTTWTLPAHASMLTGLYPEVHRVQQPDDRLSGEALLLTELLAARGFQTLAVVSGPFMSRRFGLDQGFEVYDDRSIAFRSLRESHRGVTSPRLHERLVEILDSLDDRPFFLFVHYWDVHYDYAPPPPWDGLFDPDYRGSVTGDDYARGGQVHRDMDRRDLEHVVALYDGEIAFTDRWVGRFLAELERRDLYRDSLIVLTADHGDEFFEHGRKGHLANLYNTTLRVPLIVRLPGGRAAGTRVAAPAGLVDLAPTVLEVFGIDAPPAGHGRSLVPAALGRDRGRPPLYFADLRGDLKAVVAGDWKLLRSLSGRGGGAEELYDLSTDGAEARNLRPERHRRAERLGRALDAWLELAGEQAEALGPETAELDQRLRETLESLGYLD